MKKSFGTTRHIGRALAGAALLSIGSGFRAHASDAISEANRLYADISSNRRTDVVLLPLLSKLPAAPKPVETVDRARLLPPTAVGWKEAAAWAVSGEGKALLTALRQVTAESDWKKAYSFGLPYGSEGVSPDLIRAGLFVDVGDPPTLATALLLYMPALEKLECLVNVEATRLGAEGKPGEAIDLLSGMVCFGRQMADRALAQECTWGLDCMARSYERVRDIAYVDAQAGKKLDPANVIAQIKRLDEQNAYLDLGRVKLPEASKIAAMQVIDRVYGGSESVNPDVFARTLAKVGTGGKPLRLFGASALWIDMADEQTTRTESVRRLNGAYDDWSRRWTMDWFDRYQSTPTAFEQLVVRENAVVVHGMPDLGTLRVSRHIARVEGVGARAALAAVGAWFDRKALPPQLSAVRPRWQTTLEADPYNPNTQFGAKPPLEYVIPMKDTPKDDKGQPLPHTVNIIATSAAFGSANFSLKFRDDVFLIYSWGSDNAKNIARRVQNTAEVVTGADYLIWPPVMSLYRQQLVEQGQLK